MDQPDESHDSHVSFPRYAGALLCSGIFATGLALVIPLVSLRLAADGHSAVRIGLIGVCIASGGLLAPWFVPRLVSSHGLVRVAALGLAGMVVASLLFKLTEGNLVLWYLLSLFYSVGVAIAFIVTETVLIASSSRSRRLLALGVYGGAYAVGYALGPALLAGTGIDGWLPYLVGGLLPLLALGVILRLPPLPMGGQWAGTETAAVRDVLPRMRFGMVCGFAAGAIEITVLNLFPVYAREVGHTEAQAALLLTVIGVGNVVFAPAIGWFAGRFGMGPTVAAGSAVLLVGTPVLYFAIGGGSNPAALPVMMLWGAGVEATYLLGIFVVAMGFTGLRLVTASALFAQCFSIGMLFGPLVGGVLMEHVWPPHGLLALWMALAALPPLAFLAFRRREFGMGPAA